MTKDRNAQIKNKAEKMTTQKPKNVKELYLGDSEIETKENISSQKHLLSDEKEKISLRRYRGIKIKWVRKLISLTPEMDKRLNKYFFSLKETGKPMYLTEIFEEALDKSLKEKGF